MNNNVNSNGRLNIYQKLLAIQTSLKAPKNLFNSYGKYSYRSAEGILEALKPYLAEQNCILIIEDQIYNEGVRRQIAVKDGITTTVEVPNNYIRAVAKFIDCDSGEVVETSAYARECEHKGMSADQCTGTASSYARKYCLNALFLLDDTKDSDTDEMKNIENQSKSWNNAPQNNQKQWGNNSQNNSSRQWGNQYGN